MWCAVFVSRLFTETEPDVTVDQGSSSLPLFWHLPDSKPVFPYTPVHCLYTHVPLYPCTLYVYPCSLIPLYTVCIPVFPYTLEHGMYTCVPLYPWTRHVYLCSIIPLYSVCIPVFPYTLEHCMCTLVPLYPCTLYVYPCSIMSQCQCIWNKMLLYFNAAAVFVAAFGMLAFWFSNLSFHLSFQYLPISHRTFFHCGV